MIIFWPSDIPQPPQYKRGSVNDEIISLLDLTATTMTMAGIKRPLLMQSRIFLGPEADPPRPFAFSARDRIDETVIRIRSVRDKRYHYVRNFTPGAGFPSLNRYKEKCFLIKPLMRRLDAEGKLSGPPADLMEPMPREQLYDTQSDPHEIDNLVGSSEPKHRKALQRLRAALDTWITETGDRGRYLEPEEVVAPFEKEMHEWFGTPDWYQDREQE